MEPKINQKWIGLGVLALLLGIGQIGSFLNSWQLVTGLMLVAGLLLFSDRSSSEPETSSKLPTRSQLQTELTNIKAVITKIRSVEQQRILSNQASQLATNIDHHQNFHIAVYGTKGVGKTSLIKALKGIVKPRNFHEQRKLILLETQWIPEAQGADLILFIIDGILRASEYREIIQLCQQSKRLLLILNKSDSYLPSELIMIESDLWEHTQTVLPKEDLLTCASAPAPLKVKQGPGKQWLETIPPDVNSVKQRLEAILSKEWDNLQVTNLQQKLKFLHGKAQSILFDDHRQAVEKTIKKYQWITGGAVFANPLAGLDLIASTAINTQMLMEMSQIYDRKISSTEAREFANILSQVMLKLGFVEILTSTIGNMIKLTPLTFAIGGSLQAFTAAYLTRMGGISFMKYIEQQLPSFEGESQEPKPLAVLCEETFRMMESQPLITAFLQEASLQIATAKR